MAEKNGREDQVRTTRTSECRGNPKRGPHPLAQGSYNSHETLSTQFILSTNVMHVFSSYQFTFSHENASLWRMNRRHVVSISAESWLPLWRLAARVRQNGPLHCVNVAGEYRRCAGFLWRFRLFLVHDISALGTPAPSLGCMKCFCDYRQLTTIQDSGKRGVTVSVTILARDVVLGRLAGKWNVDAAVAL